MLRTTFLIILKVKTQTEFQTTQKSHAFKTEVHSPECRSAITQIIEKEKRNKM